MTYGLKNTHTINPWVSLVLKYDIQGLSYILLVAIKIIDTSPMISSLCFAMTCFSYKYLDMLLIYVPSLLLLIFFFSFSIQVLGEQGLFCLYVFIFLKIFLMWTIFKVCIEFVTILLLFCFGFFGHEACGILAPRLGIEPALPALEGEVLTAGLLGKSLPLF